MTSLVTAIRQSTRDRRISAEELDNLIGIASQDGVTADEIRQVIAGYASTTEGFTPVDRARIWVRLTGLPANDALEVLGKAEVRTKGFHRLSEDQAKVALLAEKVNGARSELSRLAYDLTQLCTPESLQAGQPVAAEGANPQAVATALAALKEKQAALVQASQRFSAHLAQLPADTRDRLLAGLLADYSARWTLQSLNEEINPVSLAGMTDADKALVTAKLEMPATKPAAEQGTDKAFGVSFAAPTKWELSLDNNCLNVPEGTAIADLPETGTLVIEARGPVTLPTGKVFTGSVRVTDGKVIFLRGARVESDGFVAESTDEAEINFAKGILIGGPGVAVPLEVMAKPTPPEPNPAADPPPEAPWTPVEERTLRFSLTRSTLPDGTVLHQGQGQMTVLFRDGKAIGVLEGSIRVADKSVIGKEHRGESPLALADGELTRGMVYTTGDKVVGFGKSTTATVAGLGFETGYEESFAAFKLDKPSKFHLGKGATVTAVPDRPCTVTGEDLRIKLGGETLLVKSGGVAIAGGKVVGILPKSEVVFAAATVKTGRDDVKLLSEKPASWPKGGAVLIGKDGIEASGKELVITGGERSKVLPAGAQGDEPASVSVKDGHVQLRSVEAGRIPAHVEVTIVKGEVGVSSGGWTYVPTSNSATRLSDTPPSGSLMRILDRGQTYEIDPRPMWPAADGTHDGRFRKVPKIQSPHLYGSAAVKADVEAVLSGKKTLGPGAATELTRSVHQTLNHFLGTTLPVAGPYDAATQAAVERFQRLSRLPLTGRVDAATLRQLDQVAPSAAQVGKPKPKVMVMLALNTDVPDELERFKTLARERNAQAVIIGPPDGQYKQSEDLELFLQASERGEIDFDWLVISGHSGGSSCWGSNGRINYDDLKRWAKLYPTAAAQIEKLNLLNCYNVTIERANSFWPDIFPNIMGMAGFMYSAPGKKAQTSDENMLVSGRMFATIAKGAIPEEGTARDFGRRYRNDKYIMYQNASIWVRYSKSDGSEDGHFNMTSSAEYEMRRHGAGEELRVAAFAQAQEYAKYFAAEEAGYENVPAEHHTGPLREYLNAVDGVLGRWESRILQLQRYQRMAQQDPNFQMPEEYQSSWGWEREVAEVKKLRGQILFLIYFDDVRKFLDEKYGATLQALNQVLAQNGKAERFPVGQALRRLNRKEALAMLKRLSEAVQSLPPSVRDTAIDSAAWRIMKGTNPQETELATPADFLRRAQAFLGDLDPQFIAAEWL